MRSKTAQLFQAAAIFALGVSGATRLNLAPQVERDANQATQEVHQKRDDESVHTITLPHDEPFFPPGPGREEFITACVVCHSPRYITMQPRFPRSTWLSEVKKMKDAYGAHISDEQAAKITDYLVSINGKVDTGNAPKAPMANSAGNEHQPSSRTPARLVVSVLVLGTLLAWWGTRDDRRLFGEPPREPTFASPASSPRNAESDAAMVAQGYQIAESECAGCHDENTRSIGPSYREIASFYRRQSTPGNNKPNLLSAIAAAVAHPQPGWANFPPGPSLSSMPLEDRITVASWIVNVGQKKGAGEGPEK